MLNSVSCMVTDPTQAMDWPLIIYIITDPANVCPRLSILSYPSTRNKNIMIFLVSLKYFCVPLKGHTFALMLCDNDKYIQSIYD